MVQNSPKIDRVNDDIEIKSEYLVKKKKKGSKWVSLWGKPLLGLLYNGNPSLFLTSTKAHPNSLRR